MNFNFFSAPSWSSIFSASCLLLEPAESYEVAEGVSFAIRFSVVFIYAPSGFSSDLLDPDLSNLTMGETSSLSLTKNLFLVFVLIYFGILVMCSAGYSCSFVGDLFVF